METQSTIRAYQKVLSKWVFEKPISFPEEFAQKRFLKKMEVPSVTIEEFLHEDAWATFVETDNNLPEIHLPSGEWYKARNLLQSWLRGDPSRSPIDFPKGSSVVPTNGFNSIEARLSGGPWTCTPENFDKFSRLVYNHKALKRAFRRRYATWFLRSKFKQTFKESERILWLRFSNRSQPGYAIFRWKLAQIVSFVRGSRFSTVPKNNTKRRPINIEPLGNLLVQRQLGNYLRSCLKKQGVNLDTLADDHRARISGPGIATIDLKNASDSVSCDLVKFMLPKGLYATIDLCRSMLLFGADGEYHFLRKVSSMGNGFTFELMTCILTALCKTLDPEASVFGDDIIIKKDCAHRLIELLQEVGFTVNRDKSFLEGPFRESCGGNYHDSYGYIKSFDFLYPETIGDCANILTKCFALREYPSFSLLYDQLFRRTPKALRGGPCQMVGLASWDQPNLTSGFACVPDLLPKANAVTSSLIKGALFHSNVKTAVEFRWQPELRTSTAVDLNVRYHWAKYEMYLASSRITPDIISGSGRWVSRKVYVIDGQIVRFSKKYLSELRELT